MQVAIEKLNGATPAGCADQITVKFANNPANNPTKNAIADSAAVRYHSFSKLISANSDFRWVAFHRALKRELNRMKLIMQRAPYIKKCVMEECV